MKKQFNKIIAVLALSLQFSPMVVEAKEVGRPGELTPVPLGSSSSSYGFYEYLPKTYGDNRKKCPLVISLHGAGGMVGIDRITGEYPTDKLDKVLVGVSEAIMGGMEIPGVVLSPQSFTLWNIDMLDKFLDYAIENYRIDTNRIYLTGHSAGGHGAWRYAVEHADRIAALIPICGGLAKPTLEKAEQFGQLPIWAFHAWGDNKISAVDSQKWVEYAAQAMTGVPQDLLANYPGTYTGTPSKGNVSDLDRTVSFVHSQWLWNNGEVRDPQSQLTLTLYANTKHVVWKGAYANPALWDWVFQQSLNGVIRNKWTELSSESFEQGWGDYQPTGSQAKLDSTGFHAFDGAGAVELKYSPEENASFALSQSLNIQNFSEIKISCHVKTQRNNPDLGHLLIQSYNGSSWVTVKDIVGRNSLENDVYSSFNIKLDNSVVNFFLPLNVRFLATGHGDGDTIYLDQIGIYGR
jgi:dienelactone hydrolase